MKRFQPYINRTVNHNATKDGSLLSSLGVEGRYVPDTLEDFDEMEFGLGEWEGRKVIFTLVVEEGKLQRVSLGYVPEDGDEDDMVAFSQADLARVLEAKGDILTEFFEKVTS